MGAVVLARISHGPVRKARGVPIRRWRIGASREGFRGSPYKLLPKQVATGTGALTIVAFGHPAEREADAPAHLISRFARTTIRMDGVRKIKFDEGLGQLTAMQYPAHPPAGLRQGNQTDIGSLK